MTDTLRADTTLIQDWIQEGNDYDRDLTRPSESTLSSLLNWIDDFLTDNLIVGNFRDEGVLKWAYAIGAITMLIIVGYFLMKRWKRFRDRNEETDESKEVDYTISEDSIYGIDFDAELAEAMQAQDFAWAVRIVYLRSLRSLHDQGRLAWTDTKTPRELVQSISDPSLRKVFSQMTQRYVRVRYGHFNATQIDVAEMLSFEKETNTAKPTTKGGEQ